MATPYCYYISSGTNTDLNEIESKYRFTEVCKTIENDETTLSFIGHILPTYSSGKAQREDG